MEIKKIVGWLKNQPRRTFSSDGKQMRVLCPWCDYGRVTSQPHLSISVDTRNNKPLVYHCFRQSCGESGVMTSSVLQRMNCTDVSVFLELSDYNRIACVNDSGFSVRTKRPFHIMNMNDDFNKRKLSYINNRLGTSLTVPDLKNFKIQLSLFDYLEINGIREMMFPKNKCQLLNDYTIGFVSLFNDFIVLRDISDELITKSRYTIYRISSSLQEGETKIYSILTEVNLTDPKPAILNIAEGPFSILGAYLNTNIGKNKEQNCLFLANCGSGFLNTIKTVCKQFGLLSIQLNIFSDSEVNVEYYEDLSKRLKTILQLEEFKVYYNMKGEDFGIRDVSAKQITLY